MREVKWLVACILFFLASAENLLQAGMIVTATEMGNNVEFSGTGTFNLNDLNFANTGGGGGYVSQSSILFGPQGSHDNYAGITGPTGGIKNGSIEFADMTTGPKFGLNWGGNPQRLTVPVGYTSGTLLSGTMIFQNQTFSSLGLNPGTYEWTWGSGVNADSFTLQIGSSVSTVPEPSSMALFGLGAIGMAVVAVRRRRKQTSTI